MAENWKTVKVCKEPMSMAREAGEMNAYRASLEANRACSEAIENIIRKNFDGFRLRKGIEMDILDEFGAERVAYVLAVTVRAKISDGRFGKDNKDWATTDISVIPDENYGYDRNRSFIVDTHPAVLDGFIRNVRSKIAEMGVSVA